uniref:Uncharacterized protein n=1 Tax=Oryza sativa subsp. japonica TaxID=39947 RepID=Q67VQ7_ORYSJ|nr:hypothetical protein [Oryza sativa Japonica Group]
MAARWCRSVLELGARGVEGQRRRLVAVRRRAVRRRLVAVRRQRRRSAASSWAGGQAWLSACRGGDARVQAWDGQMQKGERGSHIPSPPSPHLLTEHLLNRRHLHRRMAVVVASLSLHDRCCRLRYQIWREKLHRAVASTPPPATMDLPRESSVTISCLS